MFPNTLSSEAITDKYASLVSNAKYRTDHDCIIKIRENLLLSLYHGPLPTNDCTAASFTKDLTKIVSPLACRK